MRVVAWDERPGCRVTGDPAGPQLQSKPRATTKPSVRNREASQGLRILETLADTTQCDRGDYLASAAAKINSAAEG
jgi:hypothetical protein